MSSRHSESIKYLYELQWHGVKLGLENIRRLSGLLDHPHKRYPAIHIAGTNGKGSTAAMAGSIFREAGTAAGVYTSPHLKDFSERIQVNGIPVSESGVVALIEKIRDAAGEIPLTFFEFTTAMAFLFFAESHIKIGIFETGMGGRFDATNILSPAVSIITNVDLDHEVFLGDTVSKIAKEKAGIIKKKIPVVTAAAGPEALDVIKRTAREQGAEVYRFGRDFKMTSTGDGRVRYEGLNRSIENIHVALPGDHQIENAACALAAIELASPTISGGGGLTDEVMRKGLAGIRWPGRLERIYPKSGDWEVILDGAHNPAAAAALRKYFSEEPFTGQPGCIMVLGLLKDKDAEGLIDALIPLAREVIATRPSYERALPAEELKKILLRYNVPVTVKETLPEALQAAGKAAGPGGRVLVTGSLFTVGEARSVLLGLPGPSSLKG